MRYEPAWPREVWECAELREQAVWGCGALLAVVPTTCRRRVETQVTTLEPERADLGHTGVAAVDRRQSETWRVGRC
jgi:hypothetical protein